MRKKKIYNNETTIEELLNDGYSGLEALQILDMIKNGDTVDDLVNSFSSLYNNK